MALELKMATHTNVVKGRSTVISSPENFTFESINKFTVTTKPTWTPQEVNTVKTLTMTSYAAEISTLSHDTVNITNSSLNDEYSHLDHTYNIVALIVFPLLTLGIIFGNSLVIAAYWRNKKLQTVTYEFIMLLAVADLIVGILIIPNTIFFFSSTPDFYVCILRYIGFLGPCVASTLFILFNTINTYMCVVSSLPFSKQKRMSWWIKNIGKTLTVFLTCTVGVVMPFTWNNMDQWGMEGNPNFHCVITLVLSKQYLQFISIPCTYIIGMIATGLYIALFCNVRNRTDEMLRTLNQPTQNIVSRLKRRHLKTAKTLVLVMGIFYIFYLPFAIVVSCEVYGNLDVPFLTDLRVYTSFLVVCNSAINPIIYAFRLKPFQKEWTKMLQCICKCFRKQK